MNMITLSCIIVGHFDVQVATPVGMVMGWVTITYIPASALCASSERLALC